MSTFYKKLKKIQTTWIINDNILTQRRTMTKKRLHVFSNFVAGLNLRYAFIVAIDTKNQEWFYMATNQADFSGYMKLQTNLGNKVSVVKYHRELSLDEVVLLNRRHQLPFLTENLLLDIISASAESRTLVFRIGLKRGDRHA